MDDQPYLSLNDGHRMPQFGLGVWKIQDGETEGVVGDAFRVGYRLIDTAQIYGNEAGVGRAVRSAETVRRDLFITSKLANSEQGYDSALRGFDVSLKRMGLDYLDLYLIHWPEPDVDRYADTWRAFVRLKDEGRVRSIGVSNFAPEHLRRVIAETGIVPAVNQVKLHPTHQQRALRELHAAQQIVVQSYSPLGRTASLDLEAVKRLAEKHQRTPAQVVLRWHLQQGLGVIPKSANPKRLRENFAVFDFGLDAADMDVIDRLDRQV